MALDEAILEWVAGHPDAVCLRTYGWIESTLSLGYFQSMNATFADRRWQGVPVVRRATGGGAIWHDHDLTYAIVLPAHHALARPSGALYKAVHSAIAQGLRELGLQACRRAECEAVPLGAEKRSQARPFLCFTDRDADDIVASGYKIVGSAQRRHSGSVLQHGSLLIKQSERAPELLGVCDLTGGSQDPRFWAGMVEEAVCRVLDLQPIVWELHSGVCQRAGEIEQKIYRSTAWTARR